MLVKYFGTRKYREGAGGDGDPGAGGTGGAGGAEATAAQIQAAVDAAVAGLKSKNSELLGKLTDATGKLKAFDGIDLEEVRSIHEQFKNSQDLKDIREGKIDEVLARRNEKFLANAKKDTEKLQAELEAERAKNGKFAQRVLNDSIRAAAINAGVHKHAVEDALLAARMDFTLDDEGNPVQIKDGEVVLGKNGKTPFSPDEWFATKVESKPHWFPSGSSGSPAADGGAGTPGGKTMRRAAFDALSASEKSKVAATHRIVD